MAQAPTSFGVYYPFLDRERVGTTLSELPIGGAVAQLGERVVRNHEVVSSILISSTIIPALQ